MYGLTGTLERYLAPWYEGAVCANRILPVPRCVDVFSILDGAHI